MRCKSFTGWHKGGNTMPNLKNAESKRLLGIDKNRVSGNLKNSTPGAFPKKLCD